MSPTFRAGRIDSFNAVFQKLVNKLSETNCNIRLTAISIERSLDASLICRGDCRRSAKISVTFRRQSCCQVARASMTVLGLARSRQAESLLDSLMRFHLVSHDLLLIRNSFGVLVGKPRKIADHRDLAKS